MKLNPVIIGIILTVVLGVTGLLVHMFVGG